MAGASQHARARCFDRAFHDRRILTSIRPYHVTRPYPVTLSQLQLTAADTAEDHAVSSQRLCGHALMLYPIYYEDQALRASAASRI